MSIEGGTAIVLTYLLAGTIRNAGEFNGFLKPNVRLFLEPLRFVAGELVLPSGFTPTIDGHTLAAHEIASESFMPTTAGWTARMN